MELVTSQNLVVFSFPVSFVLMKGAVRFPIWEFGSPVPFSLSQPPVSAPNGRHLSKCNLSNYKISLGKLYLDRCHPLRGETGGWDRENGTGDTAPIWSQTKCAHGFLSKVTKCVHTIYKKISNKLL